MCWILFICKGSTSFAERINQSGAIWNPENTKNLNIYKYKYQTEPAFFLATKHICEELLRENYFEDVLVNFCSFEYGGNISKAVQNITTRTLLELCQLTKIATL